MYPGSSAAPSIASRTGTDGINADDKKRRPPGQRFFALPKPALWDWNLHLIIGTLKFGNIKFDHF